ncbi:MAG TPA: SPFH domain-containing protein [Anaerolineaceae bacterium]|nr:SPFH domain-containing protein [Anaerolineaceae bacterium]
MSRRTSPASEQEWFDNPLGTERLLGLARLSVLVGSMLLCGVFGSLVIDGVSVGEIAISWQQTNPLFQRLPTAVVGFFALFLNGHALRYMIAPFAAALFVLIHSARYIKDIYNLDSFGEAFQYVIASQFGISYPTVTIDGGKMQIPAGQRHVLSVIGGPGIVIVQPGNAILLERLRRPAGVQPAGFYFLKPFERIGWIANLEDQQDDLESLETVTRDGIQVTVLEIRWRYRILAPTRNGQPAPRSMTNPYPFNPVSIQRMAFAQAVSPNGLDPWYTSVRRVVTSEISSFIAEKGIDFLTAPRSSSDEPRRVIRERLLDSPATRTRLADIGAELIWVDIGHIDIKEESVDQSRIGLWQANLEGSANTLKAYGEAKRLAYHELGRAEGQAEMVLSITQSLEGLNLDECTTETIQDLILARTAQVLDALGEPPPKGQLNAGGKPEP